MCRENGLIADIFFIYKNRDTGTLSRFRDLILKLEDLNVHIPIRLLTSSFFFPITEVLHDCEMRMVQKNDRAERTN